VAGLKTHAKALLIVRREGGRIGGYLHLSTGNYKRPNGSALLDIGLLTCQRDLAGDVAAFFQSAQRGASEMTGCPA